MPVRGIGQEERKYKFFTVLKFHIHVPPGEQKKFAFSKSLLLTILCHQIVKIRRILQNALDLFPFLPIIGRNTHSQMNSIFSLSLIVIVIVVLILKDLVSVRMATVRVKK
jgi:hypothetical protein